MQQQVSNEQQNFYNKQKNDNKQSANINPKIEKESLVDKPRTSIRDKILMFEQNSNNLPQQKEEMHFKQYNKPTFNEKDQAMQNHTTKTQENKSFITKKIHEPPETSSTQERIKDAERNSINKPETTYNNKLQAMTNNTSNHSQKQPEIISRGIQIDEIPKETSNTTENPRESFIQRRVRLFQPELNQEPSNSTNNHEISQTQTKPKAIPPDKASFDPKAPKPIEPKQTKEERINLIQERLKIYSQDMYGGSFEGEQSNNNKQEPDSKRKNSFSTRKEEPIKKKDSENKRYGKKFKNFAKFFVKKTDNHEGLAETNIEFGLDNSNDLNVQEQLNNKANNIKIDLLKNEKVNRKLEQIRDNIANSTTVFEKKYCEVLKTTLKNFLESLVFDIVKAHRSVIPNDMLLKVYLVKLESLNDQIMQLQSQIDLFYDDKVQLEEDNDEEFKDEYEMKANSMLYVMSEKETFKEIRINVISDDMMKTEIPQDF